MEEIQAPMSVFVKNVIAWQVEQEKEVANLEGSRGYGD